MPSRRKTAPGVNPSKPTRHADPLRSPASSAVRHESNRRSFLKTAAVIGAGVWISGTPARAESDSPNEKLNIGIIGCGGRGAGDLEGVSSENIVALCDVDDDRAAPAYERYPQANRYHDFRRLLEEHQGLDAVVVATPDHIHAPASVMAMRLGKHVYCEKPLTHSVYEARVMRQTAAEYKVATQMGNQGHSLPGSRRTVEIIQSGTAIGPVRQVHAWTDRPGNFWPQPVDRPPEGLPVRERLEWDLWLGPAPARPYHAAYCPFVWRGWWDFGTGALGDMACHVLDMAYWALQLEAPTSVEAEVSSRHPESAPAWSIIRYQFPARGEQPPVEVVWYDGGKKPPSDLAGGLELPDNGCILVGDSGTLYSPDPYGSTFKLLPESKFAEYKAPDPYLPDSPGHHQEWIRACKGGAAALSNFDYSARLTEAVLLGNVAIRAGQRIEWDDAKLQATNCPDAEQFIRREYRSGWSL